MASMNVKMLEEFLFHSDMQLFCRTNMSVGVGVGVFETRDVCCQVVTGAINVSRNTRSKMAFVLLKRI